MHQNAKVIYRDDKIFYDGELWNLIDVAADDDTHVNFNIEHLTKDESAQIRVHTQDVVFMN